MTTLGIGSGAMIAGLLGMNLKNFFEDYQYGFPLVTTLAFGTSVIVCAYAFTRLKRIQKLTLYGRYPGSSKKRNGNGNGNGLAAYQHEEAKQWRQKWMQDRDQYEGFEHKDLKKIKWWKRMMNRGYYWHSR
jgi:hypothetical protein